MKRINRKKLIEDFEHIRQGFRDAYDFIAKTKCQKVTMAAYHQFSNIRIAELGGEKVEDIEESPRGKKITAHLTTE